MSRRALITGITGQDGSYLSELLLAKGYQVHGLVRREALETPTLRLRNIAHLLDRLTLHAGSIDNQLTLYRLVAAVKPDECYHLAASSFISYTFDDAPAVVANNFSSTQFLLASIQELAPACRFYLAGSSEMFGDAETSPQNEGSSFRPRSIYGVAKVASHHLVANYRRNGGMHASTGILYNHESPRRGHAFVTRKVAAAVARIKAGSKDALPLGNLAARRDWGYAPEYVEAMWRMLQQDAPDDFVIATGELHTVQQLLEIAFLTVGLDYRNHVRTDPQLFRADDGVPLCGDATKARRVLGFAPSKPFAAIIEEMVAADSARLRAQHV